LQFSIRDRFYQAARITGPTHNFLGVRLEAATAASAPNVERLAGLGPGRASLDEDELVAAVLAGVAEANDRYGTRWAVTHIRYVADDSPPETAYRMIAFAIVERLANGEPFPQ
jgi:hypothetical protein